MFNRNSLYSSLIAGFYVCVYLRTRALSAFGLCFAHVIPRKQSAKEMPRPRANFT